MFSDANCQLDEATAVTAVGVQATFMLYVSTTDL